MSTGFVYVFYNVLRGFYIAKVYELKPFQFVQGKLILAFVFFAFLYYLISLLTNNFSFISSSFVRIIIKEILLGVGFVIPIYWLNLEPESVKYVQNFITKRLKK